MLTALSSDPLSLAFLQAAAAAVVAFGAGLLARSRKLHILGDLSIALVRGLVQIVAVGSVLLLMLRGPRGLGILALAGMVIAAAATSSRRAVGVPGAFRVSLIALAGGAGTTILIMTALGVIGSAVTVQVPLGSMLIASAMNTVGIALDRFRSEVEAHAPRIEAALALGASPSTSIAPYVRASFRASLIPALDNLRSLGIVWIPGLMTGMVLSGTPPVQAAVYQFVTIAMIFASSGLTCLIATTLISGRAFSAAEQLVLRPGHARTGTAPGAASR